MGANSGGWIDGAGDSLKSVGGFSTTASTYMGAFFIELCTDSNTKFYSQQIHAKNSTSMPYAFSWGQNRDICGCYVGGKLAFCDFRENVSFCMVFHSNVLK